MSETLFETAQALLSGCDTALNVHYREEDRQWRKEDLAWREQERYYSDAGLAYMHEERRWRLEDLDQRLLDNIRVLWQRYVDRTRSDMEERSEQLKGISSIAALVAGFAVSGFLQFDFDADDANNATFVLFGLTTALVVGLMLNAMMVCTLIQASILKVGRKFVSEWQEAAFVQDCLEWYKDYEPGMRPPAPQRTFTKHWNAQCEREWMNAFFMFSAGVPVFFANLTVAAYIKFHFQLQVAIGVSVVMGLSLAYFLVSQARWVSHILQSNTELEQLGNPGSTTRLPFDWHLPPEPYNRARMRRSAAGTSVASGVHSERQSMSTEGDPQRRPLAPRPPPPPAARAGVPLRPSHSDDPRNSAERLAPLHRSSTMHALAQPTAQMGSRQQGDGYVGADSGEAMSAPLDGAGVEADAEEDAWSSSSDNGPRPLGRRIRAAMHLSRLGGRKGGQRGGEKEWQEPRPPDNV